MEGESSGELFLAQMERANDAEEARRYLEAARLFDAASRTPGISDKQKWEALNRSGINYRLSGRERWFMAHTAFNAAMMATSDVSSHDRTRRDKGMLYLEAGRLEDADQLLQQAARSQYARGETLEHAATIGFIGRAWMVKGHLLDARTDLRLANQLLTGKHPLYELNNLIWLLKVESIVQRFVHLPRAVRLAFRTRYRRRALEAALITVSPRLYNWLRAHT